MAGLLDFLNTDQGRMGLGLLAAAGPRSDGAGFGQRMLEGMGSFDAYKQNAIRQKALEAQLQEHALTRQQALEKVQQEKALRELTARFATPARAALGPLEGDAQTGILPSAGRAAVAPGFDYAGYADALAAIDPAKALVIKAALKKESPKFATEPRYDQSGRAFILAENGEMKYLDGVKARDKLEEVRLGDKVAFRSPYSTEMLGDMPIGQSPDSKASNALGWANNAATLRGQNLTDSRAAERLSFEKSIGGKMQFHDGQFIAPPTAQNPGGTVVRVPGYEKPLTEAQGNAVSFALRAQNALSNLADNPTIGNKDYYAAQVPMGLGNFAMSDQGQRSMNAEKQFIAAVLRKESGAAISQGEYTSYGAQFFPRPGDSKDALAQKAQNRELAVQAMRAQAGPQGQREIEAAQAKVGGGRVPSGAPAATPQGVAPPPGTVRGGYIFKGGDPADAANWEKQ